ncbi:hypothetical protein VNO80_04541 [Phaseolus coccineus]|uniref:Uncharacterized protein n=1 Tax=Phaseolus coccineus TaxID=3886 RepID=A0AAN9P109_PHACN
MHPNSLRGVQCCQPRSNEQNPNAHLAQLPANSAVCQVKFSAFSRGTIISNIGFMPLITAPSVFELRFYKCLCIEAQGSKLSAGYKGEN